MNINNRPAVRVTDQGMHAACCGGSQWTAVKGSATVFINGLAAHRMGDDQAHCGGSGKLIEGSANVFIGDSSGGGSGTSAGPSRSGRASSSSGSAGRGSPVAAAAERQPHGGGASGSSPSAAATSSRNPAVDEGWATPMPDYLPPLPRPMPPEKRFWVDVQVVDQFDEPLAGADYELELTSGEVRKGKLDGDGVVRVEGLEPGTCRLRVPDETPPPPPRSVAVAPSAAPPLAWIEVELVDQDGAPIAGAPFELRLADGGRKQAETSSGGRIRLDGIAAGTCLLVVPDEAPPRPSTPPAPRRPAPQPARHWLELELVDQDGAPLADAAYELRLADGSARTGHVDRRGRARLEDLAPGTCHLVVGDEPPPAAVPAVSSSAATTSPRSDWLEFELVDQDGAPITASLELRVADGSTRTVVTDARGRVRVETLPPGEHALAVPDEPAPSEQSAVEE